MELEEKTIVGSEVSETTTDGNGDTGENREAKDQNAGKPEAGVEQTFTQSQVNDIVRERLERATKSFYGRYGVSDAETLDGMVEKAKGYDGIRKERDSLLEEVTFLRKEIAPEKTDDVRTWFKGKGLEFTPEALDEALKTHPEWGRAKGTGFVEVGTSQSDGHKAEEDDRSVAEKAFGIKFID